MAAAYSDEAKKNTFSTPLFVFRAVWRKVRLSGLALFASSACFTAFGENEKEADPGFHLWSDEAGRTLEARLLKRMGESVLVRTRLRKEYTLNLSKLVPADRKYTDEVLPENVQVPVEGSDRLDWIVADALREAGAPRWSP
jgi:hypothetical protein